MKTGDGESKANEKTRQRWMGVEKGGTGKQRGMGVEKGNGEAKAKRVK